MSFRICHRKIRSIQNQDQPAHMFVNVAAQRDQARFVENLCRDRTLLRTITAQVEALGGRVGKDVVISVVKIWKFNLGSNSYRKKWRNEGQIFLRDLFRRHRSWFRERPFEINYGQRRLGRKYATLGDDLVSLSLNRGRVRFRKFYASFDDSACRKRNGHDRKYCVKPQQPAEAHFVTNLAAIHQSESVCRTATLWATRMLNFRSSGRHCRQCEENRGDQA